MTEKKITQALAWPLRSWVHLFVTVVATLVVVGLAFQLAKPKPQSSVPSQVSSVTEETTPATVPSTTETTTTMATATPSATASTLSQEAAASLSGKEAIDRAAGNAAVDVAAQFARAWGSQTMDDADRAEVFEKTAIPALAAQLKTARRPPASLSGPGEAVSSDAAEVLVAFPLSDGTKLLCGVSAEVTGWLVQSVDVEAKG